MSTQNGVKGHVLGGILLIAGCSIGAGMLGLPVLTASAGFIPSAFFFILSWLFMAVTGLLLLEVNLWFNDDVNLISMTKKTLGKVGAALCWFLFLFLFYSLMVAYVAGSGSLLSGFVLDLFGFSMPPWAGSLAFIAVFGLFVYLGTQAVDNFNRVLVFGLILSYIALVVGGIPQIQPHLWMHQKWNASFLAIPTMIISFGYHNLIPSLKVYLNGDVRKLRFTILVGSAVPLVIYLIWEAIILGIVPAGGFQSALDSGEMATFALREAVGSSWVLLATHYFAFFAIVTSLLAVSLSLVDFLSDGLHIKKTALGKAFLCILTMLPPFAFAFTYPDIFFKALNYAGAFGAVIIFGIFPALMVWKGRYFKPISSAPHPARLLPGGKAALVLVILCALGIVALQIALELHLISMES